MLNHIDTIEQARRIHRFEHWITHLCKCKTSERIAHPSTSSCAGRDVEGLTKPVTENRFDHQRRNVVPLPPLLGRHPRPDPIRHAGNRSG